MRFYGCPRSAGRYAALLCLAGLWLVVGGCARTAPPGIMAETDGLALHIRDVRILPQDLNAYVDDATQWVFDRAEHTAFVVDCEARYFAPWTWTTTSFPNATDALWGVDAMKDTAGNDEPGWGENLRPIPVQRREDLVRSVRLNAFPSMHRRAVAVRPAHFRVMPTDTPFFGDPAHAGEGFPFDYFQNSVVWPGTPVLVSHATDDGAWLFAEAGYVAGWVRADALAWVDDDFVARFRTGRNAVILRDGVAVSDETGTFRFTAHLGTLLPLVDMDAQSMAVLVPAADAQRNAVLRHAILLRGQGAPWPLPPTAGNLATVGDRMMGQPYGWGGLYENRDCSAMLRDLFSCFGVWLPRNSSKQGKSGIFEDVSALSPQDKEQVLLERGVPLRTLVWLRGHIMLYLGPRLVDGQTRAIVYHDTWGVKVLRDGEESRTIIGRAVVTTLTPGAEIPGATDLRERIEGLVNLTPGMVAE